MALTLCSGCERNEEEPQPNIRCTFTMNLNSTSFLPMRFTEGKKKMETLRLLNSPEFLFEYIRLINLLSSIMEDNIDKYQYKLEDWIIIPRRYARFYTGRKHKSNLEATK